MIPIYCPVFAALYGKPRASGDDPRILVNGLLAAE